MSQKANSMMGQKFFLSFGLMAIAVFTVFFLRVTPLFAACPTGFDYCLSDVKEADLFDGKPDPIGNRGGETQEGKVFAPGGKTSAGPYINNKVNVDKKHLGSVAGAGDLTGPNLVTNNSVVINDGVEVGNPTTIYGAVIGGVSGGSGNVTSNSVTMLGGKVGYLVSGGGSSGTGSVSDNKVTIENGSVHSVFGGNHTKTGNVTGNTVTVKGGTVTNFIEGGAGGIGGTISGNSVNVLNVTMANNGVITGGSLNGSGTVGGNAAKDGNTITVQNGKYGANSRVYGGFVSVDTSSATLIGNNKVEISGGTFGDNSKIAGGYFLKEANTNEIKIVQNTVEFTSKTVFKGNVFGGNSESKTTGKTIDVSKNQVNLGGDSKIDGDVTGAYTASADATMSENLVSLSGTEVTGKITGASGLGVNKNNTIEFKGGKNTVNTLDAQTISIAGGDNKVKGAVKADNIIITGGSTQFALDLTAAANGQISVKDATVKFVGTNQKLAAGKSVTFDNGATLDVGKAELTLVTPEVLFKKGSVINIGTEGAGKDGKIVASGTVKATFENGTKINLQQVEGEVSYWSEKTLISGASLTLTDWDKLDAGFYTLELSSGSIKVSTKRTFEKVIETEAGVVTPNVMAGAATMQKISTASLKNKSLVPLTQKLEKAIQGISDKTPNSKLAVEAYKQLVGESLVNVSSSVSSTVLKTQGVVFNRLDRVREIEMTDMTPPAAGSGGELNRVWVGGFGVWAKEDDSSTVSGYDYSSGGVALGYDHAVAAVTGLRFGITGSYSSGRLKNNDDRTSVTQSTVGVGVYGSYLLPNNLFFDANVAYAHSKNDYTTNLIVGGVKTGTFDVNSWLYGLRAGYVIKGDNFQVIPSVGLRYVSLKQGDFADTLDKAAQGNTVANAYRSRTDHQVDIPLQIKFNTTVQAGSATLTPEFRLGYNFAVDRLDNAMKVGFVGSNETFELTGTRSRGNSFQGGVGLKINTGGVLDAYVNYDLDASKNYLSHNASLGFGFEF
jgi:outer membrane autotransporter protein